VTPDYFPQLGMRLVRGRLFSTEDRPGSLPVVIINERAANKYWPGQDPLGEHVDIQGIDRVVVGVVRDIRQYGPELPPRQTAFVPWGQDPSSGGELLVRTSVDPMTILPAVKAAIWSVTPGQVFGPEAATLEELLDRIIAPRRFNMALLGILGALGLAIAAAGIFGVMAYVVSQRTAEIGIRMALGATRGQIISMVLRSATTFIVTGLSVGALAAWYVSSFAEAFLFQIRPTDLRVFAAALMLLALTGLAAAAVPARRAGSVDPLRSLRES
jgi:hypothetical protein